MKATHSSGPSHESMRCITELHTRVNDTFKRRDASAEARGEWLKACEEFHGQYDALAFPGGYEAGLEKIRAGDTRAIADALAFVEIRPYFFRSQYMRKKLVRLLKHAPLRPAQSERFRQVLEEDRVRRRRRFTN